MKERKRKYSKKNLSRWHFSFLHWSSPPMHTFSRFNSLYHISQFFFFSVQRITHHFHHLSIYVVVFVSVPSNSTRKISQCLFNVIPMFDIQNTCLFAKACGILFFLLSEHYWIMKFENTKVKKKKKNQEVHSSFTFQGKQHNHNNNNRWSFFFFISICFFLLSGKSLFRSFAFEVIFFRLEEKKGKKLSINYAAVLLYRRVHNRKTIAIFFLSKITNKWTKCKNK